MKQGVLAHPVLQHFWEDHGGTDQRMIMRVLSRHNKALKRQVAESVLIEKLASYLVSA